MLLNTIWMMEDADAQTDRREHCISWRWGDNYTQKQSSTTLKDIYNCPTQQRLLTGTSLMLQSIYHSNQPHLPWQQIPQTGVGMHTLTSVILKYEHETYSHFSQPIFSDWRNANILGVKNSTVLKVASKVLRRSQEFSTVSRTNNDVGSVVQYMYD